MPGLASTHAMSSCGLVHPPNTASSPTPAKPGSIEQAFQASPTIKKCFGACDLLVLTSLCLLHLACGPVPRHILHCTPIDIIVLLSTLHHSDILLHAPEMLNAVHVHVDQILNRRSCLNTALLSLESCSHLL